MTNLLSDYLNRVLASKNLSQRELARKAGISLTAVQVVFNSEAQSPGLKNMEAIALALNIPLENMISAYKGKDPDVTIPTNPDPYRNSIKLLFQSLPDELKQELIFRIS